MHKLRGMERTICENEMNWVFLQQYRASDTYIQLYMPVPRTVALCTHNRLLEKVPRSEAIASARGFGGGVSASLSRGGEGILGLPPEEARAEHSSASLNMEPATTRQPCRIVSVRRHAVRSHSSTGN